MIKKIAVALLLTAILSQSSFDMALASPSGADIVINKGVESDNAILLQLRLRDLGYYNYKITGFFGDFTVNALKDFQKNNDLAADGDAGPKTLQLMYSNSAKRKPVQPIEMAKPKNVTKKKGFTYGKYLDWFTTVNAMWRMGQKCLVYDLDTGISYYMVRVGGHNHADVAPATASDNNKFKRSYEKDGSYPSWERRAVIVTINGVRVAGSTNGKPHGSTGVPGNGMNLPNGHLQQVCIHFLNSRNHVHNMIDPAHQYEVRRAAGLHVGARPVLANSGD